MFRCFLRPRGRPSTSPIWRTFANIPGSRGIRLSKVASMTKPPGADATLVTGREWLNHLAQNGIGQPSKAQKVYAIKNKFVVKVATQHIRKFADEPYFTGAAGNAVVEGVVRQYLRDHKKKPLWCIMTAVSGHKPIVKVKARYRLHAAFNTALKNAGYDTAGHRVRESKIDGGTPAISELFGTVQILVYLPKEVLEIPFTTLQGFFDEAVKKIESCLGRTKAPKGQAQRPEQQAQPISSRRTKVQDSRLKNEAPFTSIRPYDSSSPRSRGPQTLRSDPSRGRGDGSSRQQWRPGDSRSQSNRQRQARNNEPINTGF